MPQLIPRSLHSPVNSKATSLMNFLEANMSATGAIPSRITPIATYTGFDGDGMLTGVFFERTPGSPGVQPLFTNQYVLTDVHRAVKKSPWLYPILPSVTTLVNPENSPFRILLEVMRSMVVIFASIWGFIARPIKRVSSANTSIVHHDGRVLATCEIGPPIRVFLPSLKTIGWFTGCNAEGESPGAKPSEPYFGGKGVEGFYKEMTTAHPRVDPDTGELLLFHSTFLPPFVHYSIVPPSSSLMESSTPRLNQIVPGLSSGKMMHDFGVSQRHTIMVDCPLSLDPSNLTYKKPVVEYDPSGLSRLGVFPRYSLEQIQWYETDACLVMHTVNSWDEEVPGGTRVHILLCRMNSIAPILHMGNMEAPGGVCPQDPEYRLYYYQFPPKNDSDRITQQWALSAIPF